MLVLHAVIGFLRAAKWLQWVQSSSFLLPLQLRKFWRSKIDLYRTSGSAVGVVHAITELCAFVEHTLNVPVLLCIILNVCVADDFTQFWQATNCRRHSHQLKCSRGSRLVLAQAQA